MRLSKITNIGTIVSDNTTLFEKIGGYEGVQLVVKGMYEKIFNDPEVSQFFRKTDKAHQMDKMVQFIVYTTGGCDEWQGKYMKETHQGRGIHTCHFETVIGFLVQTMEELGLIEDYRTDMVERLELLKPAYLEED